MHCSMGWLLALALLGSGFRSDASPHHGYAATGALINDYAAPVRLSYGHGDSYVRGSLSAHPIVVAGPQTGSAAVIGPSEGPVLVQGPRQGSATIVGPSEGPATIVGPRAGAATIVGPTAGAATIVGPNSGGANIVGPSEGGAIIVGPSSGGATIVGPSDGGATVVGPSAAGATIIGPSVGHATIVGPSVAAPTIVTHPAVEDAHAHAHAEAHAEAHAHAHAHDVVTRPVKVIVEPPHQHVYIKDHPTVHQYHHHHVEHPNSVICDLQPALAGWDTSSAVNAVASAASHYGPVHVSSSWGRPVVTVSGPSQHHGSSASAAAVASVPHVRPIAVEQRPIFITGHSGSIGSSSSSASSSASASSWSSGGGNSLGYYKKYWYPTKILVDC